MYLRWIRQSLVLFLLICTFVVRPSVSARSLATAVPDGKWLEAPAVKVSRADLRKQGADVDISLKEVVGSEEVTTIIYGLRYDKADAYEGERADRPIMLILHLRDGGLLGVQTLSVSRSATGQTLTVESTPAATPDRFLRTRITLSNADVMSDIERELASPVNRGLTKGEKDGAGVRLTMVTRASEIGGTGWRAQTEIPLGTIRAQSNLADNLGLADPAATFTCPFFITDHICCIGNCLYNALGSLGVDVTLKNIHRFAKCLIYNRGQAFPTAIACLFTSGLARFPGDSSSGLIVLLRLANCLNEC